MPITLIVRSAFSSVKSDSNARKVANDVENEFLFHSPNFSRLNYLLTTIITRGYTFEMKCASFEVGSCLKLKRLDNNNKI